jgi:hypothetical protein
LKRYLVVSAILVLSITCAAAKNVTIDNFVRAETDTAIRNVFKQIGFGAFHHERSLAPLDNQAVIRQNRDTLYSTAVLDLSVPASLTFPDTRADGARPVPADKGQSWQSLRLRARAHISRSGGPQGYCSGECRTGRIEDYRRRKRPIRNAGVGSGPAQIRTRRVKQCREVGIQFGSFLRVA